MACDTVVDIVDPAITIEGLAPLTVVEVVDEATTTVDVSSPVTVVEVDPSVTVVEVGLITQTTNIPIVAYPAGEALAEGDVLALDDGELFKADPDTSGERFEPVGVSPGVIASGASVALDSIQGTEVEALFDSAPPASANDRPCYLSETIGRASVTPPTTSGLRVSRLGIIKGADGVLTLVKVLWSPQFLIDN